MSNQAFVGGPNETVFGRGGENHFDRILLNRTPILDRTKSIRGYHFDVLAGSSGEEALRQEKPDRALLAEMLNTADISALSSERPAFVAANLDVLDGEDVGTARKKKVVFEFAVSDLEGGNAFETLMGMGSERPQFCLRGHAISKEARLLLSFPCFVRIDIDGTGDVDLDGELTGLKNLPVTTIAGSVDSLEAFDNCLEAGFDLFHGEFFRKPGVLTRASISPNHALLLDLSARTGRDDDLGSVEAIFKKNPDLAYGLFNLVHSAFFGVSKDVTSIRQAIALLGYRDLHKWAALMLFTIDHSDPFTNPLFENVLVRARTMELLAAKLRTKGLSDPAYMTGIFSLVPILFDVSLEDIAVKANFGEDIREALISGAGNLGSVLRLVEGLEKGAYGECAREATELGLGLDQVVSAHMAAVAESSGASNPAREWEREKRIAPQQPASSATTTSSVPPGQGGRSKPSLFRRVLSFFRKSY